MNDTKTANDRKIMWDVSDWDWRKVKEKFDETIPEDDNSFRINYSVNHIPHTVWALLLDLNKRVKELEEDSEK